jgi:uncharacterized protein YxeA
MRLYFSTYVKITLISIFALIILVGLYKIEKSHSLTPKERALSYMDKTITKINNDPFERDTENSFTGKGVTTVDRELNSYNNNGGEEHMQFKDTEYLRNVKMYDDALVTPRSELGIDPNIKWLSHTLKDDVTTRMKNEFTITLENDSKLIKGAKKVTYKKIGKREIFTIYYPAKLEIEVLKLGGEFSGDIVKQLTFENGLLHSGWSKPSGEAKKHLSENKLEIKYGNFLLKKPEKVVNIESLTQAPSFPQAQIEINSQVYLMWVLRVALSKSNFEGKDYSADVMSRVVQDFISKRYVPSNSSLQVINGKANLTVFPNENKDVNDPLTLISCGDLVDGRPVIKIGRCT